MEIAAIIISLISLFIAASAAWLSTFKPPKLLATMPHAAFWQASSWKGDKPTGDVVTRCFSPALVISNGGARDILIEDIRIQFTTPDTKLFAYPTGLLTDEEVTSLSHVRPTSLFSRNARFSGIVIRARTEWFNRYLFGMNVNEFEKLIGKVTVDVQLIRHNTNTWSSVLSEAFDFGTHPYHIRPLKNEDGIAAGGQLSHAYSESWLQRRR